MKPPALLCLMMSSAIAACSSTQSLTFFLPVLPSDIAVHERGSGVVFVIEPFCVSVSEGASANVSVKSMGPAFIPLVPLGNSLSGKSDATHFDLEIELIGDGHPFAIPLKGIAVRFDDNTQRAPVVAQISFFSTAQKSRWSPIGNLNHEEIVSYHHDGRRAYQDMPDSIEVEDTVRLTLAFARQGSEKPVSLVFPPIPRGGGDWLMPPLRFQQVTREKYNPGGGVTADGVAVGSMPVTACRKLGHSHA
jgi:hypothetical protein